MNISEPFVTLKVGTHEGSTGSPQLKCLCVIHPFSRKKLVADTVYLVPGGCRTNSNWFKFLRLVAGSCPFRLRLSPLCVLLVQLAFVTKQRTTTNKKHQIGLSWQPVISCKHYREFVPETTFRDLSLRVWRVYATCCRD